MADTCTCLKDVEQRVMEVEKENGNSVEGASLRDKAFFFNGGTKTISVVELKRDNRKLNKRVTVIHSFCPFCGTAYKN